MSKEFLNDVLEKFAQVTGIIVEASKIKEDLDAKNPSLKQIKKRTEQQVQKLFEHANSVKEFFHKKHNEKENGVNGKGGCSDDNSRDTQDKNESDESDSLPKKPLIKLVDINKLVEPRTLICKSETSQPSAQTDSLNETVVVISSDEESRKTRRKPSPAKGIISRRKTTRETIKKMRQAYDNTDSSDSSEDEVLSKMNKRRKDRRIKNQNLEKVTLSETSSLSSNSDDNSVRTNETGKLNKHKKKNTEEQKIEEIPDWKTDPKYKSECYVKMIRIPCEKMKEYYLEKLELLEINKLCDDSSLARKRRRSHSASCSEKETVKKRKPRSKPKKKIEEKTNKENSGKENSDKENSDKENSGKENSDKEKNDSDATVDDLVPEIANETILEEPATKNTNEDAETAAEDALNLLNSDNESSNKSNTGSEMDEPVKEDNDKENEDEDKNEKDATEEKQPDSKVNSDKNEEEPVEQGEENKENEEVNKEIEDDKCESNKENDEEKDKEEDKESSEEQDKGNDDEKDKEKDEESDKEQDKETDKDEETNDDEEESKKKDKSKKAWRKDKLLTEKLTSSDSEDEFQKFCRKKKDMQDEVLRITKKRKKAVVSDSDSDNKKDSGSKTEESSSSSESEKEKEEEKPKSRKRVKRVRDSSDEDDESKTTRKQIRNIWGRDSLAETTKQAEAEEKERKARILEKQKKYNQIYEANLMKNSKVEKVVLDFDDKNEKELLKLDDEIVSKLKPHQASGIQFMWDACFESLERAQTTTGSGCILAHCMGLGKTLQVIALSHTLLVNSEQTQVKKVLVVSPLNTVLNWVSEFKQWVPDNDDFEVFELVSFKQNYERQYQVKQWHNHGGVLIIGYDMFRNLSNPDNKRLSKKMRQVFQEALVDPGPDLVVCDEGHLLKNEKTNISIAMNRIKTLRRIVLTGTPLQNNLKEYFCMVQFIKPNLLGTYKEYLNRFVNPITNGQYTDSTLHDIQIMRKRSHVLHKMLDGVVQRRDYSVLQPYLPPKHEYVLFLKLTEVQIKLYQHYMNHFARRSTDGSNRTSFLFVDFQNLQRICTHPRVLLDKSNEMKLAKEKRGDSESESEGSLKDFINDDDEEESISSSRSNSSDEEGDKGPSVPRKRVTRAAAALAKESGEDIIEIPEDPQQKEWWQEYCDGDELNVVSHSSKLFLLFEILKECEQIGDKILVFSQSLYSLNIIEYFLGKVHDATQLGETMEGYTGSWCLGLDYFRLDGSSSCDNRSMWCKTFNDPSNNRARLFLISTKAGGLGINLVGANRVIIFDVSWNPSHDIQSIYRVYRFGQTKPCYIYRFVTLGTMEMKIYERQVIKQAISKRVIDEQQIDRHYNQNDLAELYRFEPDPGERPIPLVPKDVLLGELVQKSEDRIYKFHEHQTLLENKQDEELNEEERKAAWEEFENEKKQRNYLGNYYDRPNNQWELALASIVRKENPTWSEAQIKAMIPALQMQLQQQVSAGELSMYKRVQQEINHLQALHNQRLKEQFYQQQLTQQLAAAMKFHNSGWLSQYQNQMPGTSRVQPPVQSNPNEIIDLND